MSEVALAVFSEVPESADLGAAECGHALANCAVCGQLYDMKKLEHAYHHDSRPHLPLR